MEQIKALNALEPFLALSKSANSPRAAADLVTRATSNPNTFIFAELLETPQIRALAGSPEFAPYLRLLEIFSHGTYDDYREDAAAAAAAPPGSNSSLPTLNDAQLLKLRQLSLLTLARDRERLTYAALTASLGLADARELEATVISAVYAGLVVATLDPAHQVVQVSSVAPLRDLVPSGIPALLTALRAWSGRCEATLADLRGQVDAVKSAALQRAAERRAWDEQIARAVEHERVNPYGSAPAGGGADTGRNKHQAGTGTGTGTAMALGTGPQQRPQRFGKRTASGLASDSIQDVADDEAMDVDDDDGEGGGGGGGADGKKRASRRKL